MARRRLRPEPTKWFRNKWLLVANLVILVLIGMSFGREFLRDYQIQKDIETLQTQAEELQVKNTSIRELALAFQTESYLEREARLKLGMKKPGEEVVVVRTNPQGAQTEEAVQLEGELETIDAAIESAGTVSALKKWWVYVFDPDLFLELKYQTAL